MFVLICVSLILSAVGSARVPPPGHALLAGVPKEAVGAGWHCSTGSALTSYCGAFASLVGSAFPLTSVLPCLGKGSLVMVGDSVSRHALFDWLGEDVAGCETAELDGASEGICAALYAAGQKRGNYAVGTAPLRVWALPDTESIVAAVSGGATATFLSSTFIRNVTEAPWLGPALRAVAATRGTLVLSGGLWNLKYDESPLATLQEEARGLLAAVRAAGVPPTSMLWRGLSATDALPTLPSQYTPAAVAEARAWLAALWEGAGVRVLDIAPITSCAAPGATPPSCRGTPTTPASGITVDGTHLPTTASVGVMRATLHALPCGASTDSSSSSSKAAGARSLGFSSLASLAASNAAAADASQAPPLASLAAAPPAPAAAAPPAPAAAPPKVALGGFYYTLAVFAMAGLLLLVTQFQGHRHLLESLLKTPLGAGVAYATVLLAVLLCDVQKVFPIVDKEKPVGFDQMLVFFFLTVAVALRTAAPVAAAPPGQRPGGVGKVATPERAASPASAAAASGAGGDAEAGSAGVTQAPAASSGLGAAAAFSTSAEPSASVLETASLLEVPPTKPTAVSLTNAGAAAAAATQAPTSAAVATPAGGDSGGFFPLPQSLEWKGWMMAFFLLYHYWDVKAAYNPIRVAVGAYLFLTGYGNFMSLSKKGPSLQKLAMSVLRINLFTASVMLITGRGWVLYYIAPLHTFWTCVVYVYFWLPYPALHKLGAIFAAIVVVYEVPHIANYLFVPGWPLLAYCSKDQGLTLNEWVFRSRLDAYAPFSGMVFAYFVPSIVEWLDRDREEEGGGEALAANGAPPEVTARVMALYPGLPHALASLAHALGLLKPSGAPRLRVMAAGGLLAVVLAAHSQMYAMERFEYNKVNRFTEWIPITAFLTLRNLTPALRGMHLRLFAWLGEMSLELYILQFHVWMAEDAKKLVVLFPNFRTLSFLIATTAFVIFAWASSAATGLAMKKIEALGRNAVLGVAGGLLGLMTVINMMPRACALGGAGG